jgi:tungstate transport system substrate-binding protein
MIPLNPKMFPHVQFALAEQFAAWITSARGQQVIRDYRLLNRQLFYPDALDN